MEITTTGITLENMGVLDLSGKKSSDLSGISLIQNIGVILAPHSLTDALLHIPQRNIGTTVMLPDTQAKIKILSGQLTLSGEVFANNSGSSDEILVIVGQVIITSPIEKVGYNEVIVAGQLIAHKKNEAALTSALSRMSGQIAYYNADTPRLFMGSDKFSKEFFELVEDKMAMIIVGNCEIESDVEISLIKQKISEVVLIGELSAPKALLPLLQMLTVTKLGKISVRDDAFPNVP